MKNLYLVRDERQRAKVIERIYDLPMPFYITAKPAGNQRSMAANRLMWMWLNIIQKHMAEHFGEMASADDWHDVLVEKLCPAEHKIVKTPDGEKHIIGRARTSKMSVQEMSEYLGSLEMYCAEYLNLQLPRPDDLYWVATMDKKQ